MILTIEAGPGSGKTYTICNALAHIQRHHIPNLPASDEQLAIYEALKQNFPQKTGGYRVIYFSHTNSVKDVLVKRLPKKTPVFTFHGAGQSELIKLFGYQQRDNNRIDPFIENLAGIPLKEMTTSQQIEWYYIKTLVKYFKIEYLPATDNNFEYIVSKYPELDARYIPKDWMEKVKALLIRCNHPNKFVDYNDMVWMATNKIRRPRYDIGFIDESQDLGGATLALVQAMCYNLVFVGDRNQAIMAFAGADEQMFDKVLKISDLTLPLKTTFRCPLNIVDRANHLKPGSVLPGPNKQIGDDLSITYQTMITRLKKLPPKEGKTKLNVMIISRTNAPLMSLGLSMLRNGLNVELADKDFGTRIVNFVKNLHCGSIQGLEARLNAYQQKENKKPHPMAALLASELCEAILNLAQDCHSLEDLYRNIRLVTENKGEDRYLLASIHKSKGLEANNIFILNPPIEHPLAMKHPISAEQETNLHFVAITRTAKNLYWVSP